MITLKFVVIALASGLIAQIIKVFSYFLQNRKLNLKRMFETGGMPSSHASTSSTITILVGLNAGFNSIIFTTTLFFSLVIMYDAAGLRRAAGKQAAVLNKIIDEFQQTKHLREERLMELLGHTPLEVFFGAILGVLVAFAFN